MSSPPLALRWLAASRPGFLVVTLVATLVGIGSALACGVAPRWPEALATVVLALLTHAAVNLHNDWGDALIGSDAVNTDRIGPFTGGSRVVQDGVFMPVQLKTAVQMLAMVVTGGGLLLAARSGPGLLLIGLAGLLLGWAYSQPRLALMSRGWGELAVAAGWWLVVVGADFVQRRAFGEIAMIVGVSPALLIAAVARGTALDMGDSVVTASAARQQIPDLSGLSHRVFPLIQHMLEPDPASRPLDMGVVLRMLDDPSMIPAHYRFPLWIDRDEPEAPAPEEDGSTSPFAAYVAPPAPEPAPAPATPEDIVLLREIRDSLKR